MPAEAAPTGHGEFALGDVMAELNSEPEETAAETTTEPAKPAPKGKEAKAAPARPKLVEAPEKPESGKLTEDFSDDRPWTKERVKAAAAEAQKLARDAQRQWTQLRKREEKFSGTKNQLLTERQQERAIRDQLAADLQALRTGTPRVRLDALGRLAATDGVRLWEEIELDMARGGKKAEMTPGEQALRAEVDQLKATLNEREMRKEIAQREQFVSQRQAQLGEVGSDPDLFPELSVWEPNEIGEALAEVITRVYNETGKRISDLKAAKMLEQDLAERRAKRGSGLETRAEKAKPDQAQSPPPQRGRSLAPGLSAQSASRRELTDDEIAEDAADFLPASLLRAASPRRF
jgi:hypothetical protein